MGDVLAIAARNLARYRRRTVLTAALIAIGILAVLVFVAVTGSFKAVMIGQITDSMLGHLQVQARLRRLGRQPAAEPEPAARRDRARRAGAEGDAGGAGLVGAGEARGDVQ